jgi:hypothetical protein
MDPVHKVMSLEEAGLGPANAWDDELHFNTQKTSQWDSLCHWPDPVTKLAYNGTSVTKEGLSTSTTEENQLPTLDHWHGAGCLVARGVLIDYKSWFESRAAETGKSGEEATSVHLTVIALPFLNSRRSQNTRTSSSNMAMC